MAEQVIIVPIVKVKFIFKKIFCVFFLLLNLISCGFFYQKNIEIKTIENSFIEGSSDIPLLVGMRKISDDDLGFDSSNGSISSAIYSFENDHKKFSEFYVNTLEQLGWKKISQLDNKIIFQREKQNLTLEINQQRSFNTIKFFISSLL
jgi:hypothetical protein